ncbi:unnamed protein product [Rhizoctonia solani]|uniref:Uncharacterized protein n=1 Tax=Rhizoctonia solani TaxID=456999 RepID=A0A8H3D1F0_9AGAM|nr:unnamed protein product [Rhizoctonia solani]
MNFGPKLQEYLISCRESPFSGHTPSTDEIQRAIAALVDPPTVSYKTFETILALERAPLCAHISFLLTGAHILPSCIRLLKWHCNDHIHLFDHAYGYLCFQVMNLSIEIAKLAQVNKLQEFLQRGGARDKFISKELAVHMRKWKAKEFAPPGLFLNPATKLLGWRTDTSSGLVTALSRIGGFTIRDVEFLLMRIWEARDKFLKTLKCALDLQNYAGWCGIIHLMHNTLVRMNGIANVDGQVFDDISRWKCLIDVIHRYALCANYYEESTISYLLKDRPNNGREKYQITALDSADVDRIVAAYINKTSQQPTIVYAHTARLFSFAMKSCYLDESKFTVNVTRITQAALESSWVQIGTIGEAGISAWTYFADTTFSTHIVIPTFTKFIHMHQIVMEIIVNESLLDFLGYFALYPLTAGSKAFVGIWRRWLPNQLRVLDQFASLLKNYTASAPMELIDVLHSIWNKTAQSLEYQKVMKRSSEHARDYISTWKITWNQIGEAIGGYPSRCGYPRCPAPEAAGRLQCAGCLGIGMPQLILIDRNAYHPWP